MVRDKILDEIRRLELKAGDVWDFKKVILFRNNSLNPIEKKELDFELVNICNEGIFTKEGEDTNIKFRLTEQGERVIYSK